MIGGKISKLVVVITSKETGEHVERWQFDVKTPTPLQNQEAHFQTQVQLFNKPGKKSTSQKVADKENAVPESVRTSKHDLTSGDLMPCSSDAEPPPEKTEKEIQGEIQSIFRQITASVTFLPQLDGSCTFNVLVYADADSDVPLEWGDSDAKDIKDAERVQLRSFSTNSHKVDTLVSYR